MTGFPAIAQGVYLLADQAYPATEESLGSRFVALLANPHLLTWGIVLGGLAMWLMLPRGKTKSRGIGAVLGIVALGCFGSRLLPVGNWSDNVIFWIISGVTIVSAACTVTFRSPVYCAIWFAMTLTGTAGIFMIQGAQFLAVATIVVYAGAILVTFLFVLMLASPKGNAYYDRVSWEALLAAGTGAVLLKILSITIGKLNLDQTQGPATTTLGSDVLTADHVARLGGELFGRHLIAVEVAGTLLLVALVGATAIVSAQRRRPGISAADELGSPRQMAAGNGQQRSNWQEASR